MSFVGAIIEDLRERRLWPVAVVLAAALLAVPTLLSKSPAATPVAGLPPAASAATPPPAIGLPVVSASTAPSHSRLRGGGRDPFERQGSSAAALLAGGAVSPTSSAALQRALAGKSAGAGASSGAAGSSPTSKPGTSSTTTGTAGGATTTPVVTPSKPASPSGPVGRTQNPTVLSDTESFQVSLAITNPSGGLDSYDSLERLSILPNANNPMLVELGVLRGGKEVLFVPQPGTVLSGPGKCTPGPLDCQMLALEPNQIESLSVQDTGGTQQVALFAITAIKVAHHSSAGAATKARSRASAAGARLLAQEHVPALGLFPYKPRQGVLVDLRNVKVGSR